MEFKKVSACNHEPKIVIKSFSIPNGLSHIALCKSCSNLDIFNKFLVGTFELNTHNIQFLQLTEIYVIKEYTYFEN